VATSGSADRFLKRKAPIPASDKFVLKSSIADAKRRAGRQRVCDGCKTSSDYVFGSVHSEAECMRCGKKPMGYGAIVGESAASGGIR
jgi:hypothetical protein